MLSFGVVTDFIGRAPLDWTGRCGTARCIGDGYLNEFNIIFEGKLTTPVAPLTTAHVYAGVGGALLMPTGQPTGPFGPSFGRHRHRVGVASWRRHGLSGGAEHVDGI